MLVQNFPLMFVSSLREFPENCVFKQCGLNYCIEYLHRKLQTANVTLTESSVLTIGRSYFEIG
jgi:hypothetical protein